MDRGKNTNKFLELLQTNQFIKLNYDPKKSTEHQIQRTLTKFKNRL